MHLPRPPPSVLPRFFRHPSPLLHRARPASTGAVTAAAAAGSPLDVAPIYAAGSALISHPVFPSPSNAALDAHLSLPPRRRPSRHRQQPHGGVVSCDTRRHVHMGGRRFDTVKNVRKRGGYLIIYGCYNGRFWGAQGALSAQKGAQGRIMHQRPEIRGALNKPIWHDRRRF